MINKKKLFQCSYQKRGWSVSQLTSRTCSHVLKSPSQRRSLQCSDAEVRTACISMCFKRKTAGNLQIVAQCHPGASMVIVKLIIWLLRDIITVLLLFLKVSNGIFHCPGRETPSLTVWSNPYWSAMTPPPPTSFTASCAPWGRWPPALSAPPPPAPSLGLGYQANFNFI